MIFLFMRLFSSHNLNKMTSKNKIIIKDTKIGKNDTNINFLNVDIPTINVPTINVPNINVPNINITNTNLVPSTPIKKSTDLIKELLQNQLPNINPSKKLNYNDLKRISKFLSSSIFDKNNCALWTGYITNEKKNQTKGIYINFYFNQKKIALHRLLYLNYIGEILNTEYIKFSCVNKGKCCNIHHMNKFPYNLSEPHIKENNELNTTGVHIMQNKNDLILEI